MFFALKEIILHSMGNANKYSCNPKEWVQSYSNELFRFALLRVNNREIAEDLVQETFLSGLKARDKFRLDCSEKSWLYNILRNKIIDHYRKKTNKEIKQSASSLEVDDDSFFNHFFQQEGKYKNHWNDGSAPGDFELPADSLFEREEFMEILKICLSRLPEQWAKVFSLKNIDEYSSKEICKELQLTSSNLWTIIHRAKLQLRGCLETKWLNN